MATRPVYGVMDFLAGFRLPAAPSAAPADGEMYAADGKVYLRDSGAWVEIGAGGGGGGASRMDDLSDVDVSDAVTGEVLTYHGGTTVWVGLPVTVTRSNHYSTDVAANVWDKSPATKWNTGTDNPSWTVADFGVPVTASRIIAGSEAVAVIWTLSGSADGTAWTTLKSGISAALGVGNTYDFTEATYRYWRMETPNAWTDPHTFGLYRVVGLWQADALPSSGGSGTVILSGTATPTAGTGNVGEYYLDTDGQILYGPKADINGVAPYSALTTQTGGDVVTQYDQTRASDFTFATDGNIVGLRYYRPAAATYARPMKLWSAAGVKVGEGTDSTTGTSGWKTISITPVAVTAGQTFRVSVEIASTDSVQRKYPSFGVITNGAVTLTNQHWTGSGTGTYPNNVEINGIYYWVDVLFDTTPSPWPVALRALPPGGTTSQALVKTSSTDYATQWSTPAAAGSVILSGTATPDAAVGAVGDYYLDTDDRILYGPKRTPTEGYVSPPTTRNEGGPVHIGQKFRFSTAGYVSALRILLPSGTSGVGWNAYLFKSDGAILGSIISPSLALGWNQIALPSLVPVVANQTYIVAVWVPSSATHCAVADGAYTGQTSGGVIGLAEGVDGTAVNIGGSPPGTMPTSGWNNHSIGVSPVFIADVTWPVALKSVPPGGTTSQVLAKTSATDYDATWATPAAGGGGASPGSAFLMMGG